MASMPLREPLVALPQFVLLPTLAPAAADCLRPTGGVGFLIGVEGRLGDTAEQWVALSIPPTPWPS
jgi:hypothetical protein